MSNRYAEVRNGFTCVNICAGVGNCFYVNRVLHLKSIQDITSCNETVKKSRCHKHCHAECIEISIVTATTYQGFPAMFFRGGSGCREYRFLIGLNLLTKCLKYF